MVKKILMLVVILILAFAGASYYLFSNLDSLVRQALETFGTQITGTQVKVSGVHISLRTGEGSISGFAVSNPKDFSGKSAFELGSISIALDTRSVMGNGPIIIRKVDIEKPLVNYEVNNSGAANLQTIMHNIQGYSAPHTTDTGNSTEPEKKANSRKVVISDFYIRGGLIKISNKMLPKDITAPLSDIHMTNIGQDSGTSPAQAAKDVLETLTSTSLSDAASGLTRQLRSLNINNVVNQNTGDVGNKLKGLLR